VRFRARGEAVWAGEAAPLRLTPPRGENGRFVPVGERDERDDEVDEQELLRLRGRDLLVSVRRLRPTPGSGKSGRRVCFLTTRSVTEWTRFGRVRTRSREGERGRFSFVLAGTGDLPG